MSNNNSFYIEVLLMSTHNICFYIGVLLMSTNNTFYIEVLLMSTQVFILRCF